MRKEKRKNQTKKRIRTIFRTIFSEERSPEERKNKQIATILRILQISKAKSKTFYSAKEKRTRKKERNLKTMF